MAPKILPLLIICFTLLSCTKEKSIEEIEKILIGQWKYRDEPLAEVVVLPWFFPYFFRYMVFFENHQGICFTNVNHAMASWKDRPPMEFQWHLVGLPNSKDLYLELISVDYPEDSTRVLFRIDKITSSQLNLQLATQGYDYFCIYSGVYYKLR